MRSAIALLSALTGLVGAYTTPVGNPSGNPIAKPGLGEIVPVGTPYTITWNPTSTGTVTLVLLRGPSENVVPLYPIAERIDNSGTYSWLPATDLVPDTSRYGIQLIQDADGAYQYSTQFGISGGSGSSSSSSTSGAPTASSNSTSSYATVSSTTATYNCTSCPSHNKTTSAYMTGTTSIRTLSTTASLTPTASANSTIVTYRSSTPSTTAPTSTRAASSATASSNVTSPAGSNAGVKQLAVPLSTAAFTVLGLFAAYCL